MSDLKCKFTEIVSQKISRNGIDKLLNWLDSTDFYTAPASTKFHGACESGLLMHSILVYETLMEKYFDEDDDEESFAICGLFHDLCKTEYYVTSTRNVKNDETGLWEKKPYYKVEDKFPYGHGEKSAFLIERFMRLKTAEAVAIRWHMGGFDDSAGSFALSCAYREYPLAVKLHLADLESTYIKERGSGLVY